jgi:hypothetical protein
MNSTFPPFVAAAFLNHWNCIEEAQKRRFFEKIMIEMHFDYEDEAGGVAWRGGV